MPDLSFENFNRFHRRFELRIKRIFNAQSLELFLTVQFRLLAQQHPVFRSHGHHHLKKTVDWRILFPRDACVWFITRQDWFCLLCSFVSLRRLVSRCHLVFSCHLLPLYHHVLQLRFVHMYCLISPCHYLLQFNCVPWCRFVFQFHLVPCYRLAFLCRLRPLCFCQQRLCFFFHWFCPNFKSWIDIFYQRACFLSRHFLGGSTPCGGCTHRGCCFLLRRMTL